MGSTSTPKKKKKKEDIALERSPQAQATTDNGP